MASQGYNLDEWLVCALNQVQFDTYVSDTDSWAKTAKFLILRNGTSMSATNQNSSKWYPRLVTSGSWSHNDSMSRDFGVTSPKFNLEFQIWLLLWQYYCTYKHHDSSSNINHPPDCQSNVFKCYSGDKHLKNKLTTYYTTCMYYIFPKAERSSIQNIFTTLNGWVVNSIFQHSVCHFLEPQWGIT